MKSFTQSIYKYILFFIFVPQLSLVLVFPDNMLQFLETKIWWISFCVVWFLSTNTNKDLKQFNYKVTQSALYLIHYITLSIIIYKFLNNQYLIADMNYFDYRFFDIFIILDVYFFFTFFGMISAVESQLFTITYPTDDSKEKLDKFVNHYKNKTYFTNNDCVKIVHY